MNLDVICVLYSRVLNHASSTIPFNVAGWHIEVGIQGDGSGEIESPSVESIANRSKATIGLHVYC